MRATLRVECWAVPGSAGVSGHRGGMLLPQPRSSDCVWRATGTSATCREHARHGRKLIASGPANAADAENVARTVLQVALSADGPAVLSSPLGQVVQARHYWAVCATAAVRS